MAENYSVKDPPRCTRCGTEMEVAVTSSNLTGWGCPKCDLPDNAGETA